MRRHGGWLAVLAVVVVLGCGGRKSSERGTAGASRPVTPTPLQAAYTLLDDLIMLPVADEPPAGLRLTETVAVPPPGLARSANAAGAAWMNYAGLDGLNRVLFIVFTNEDEARAHFELFTVAMLTMTETSQFQPADLPQPARCSTGIAGTGNQPRRGSTVCAALAGAAQVWGWTERLGGAERGDDTASVALAMTGLRRLEAVRREAERRAASPSRQRTLRIGWLGPDEYWYAEIYRRHFHDRMRELGWARGLTLTVEYRFASGARARLPELASELVREGVDLIVGDRLAAVEAAKAATSSIPIIFIAVGDEELLRSLVPNPSRPEGNITGVGFWTGPEIYAKRLEILSDAFPSIVRVAVLTKETAGDGWSELEQAAQARGIQLIPALAGSILEVDRALAAAHRDGAQAVLEYRSALVGQQQRLDAFQRSARVPVMYDARSPTGPISYMGDVNELHRRGAEYVDRVLRGAKPRDLPVERNRYYELLVNLRHARDLGLTVHPSVLARATEVIE